MLMTLLPEIGYLKPVKAIKKLNYVFTQYITHDK